MEHKKSLDRGPVIATIIIGTIFSIFIALASSLFAYLSPFRIAIGGAPSFTYYLFPSLVVISICSIVGSWWQYSRLNSDTAQLISVTPTIIVVLIVIVMQIANLFA